MEKSLEIDQVSRKVIQDMIDVATKLSGMQGYSVDSLFSLSSISKLTIMKIDTIKREVVVAERCLEKFLTQSPKVVNRIISIPIERISEHLLTKSEFDEVVRDAARMMYLKTYIVDMSEEEFIDYVVAAAEDGLERL